VSEIVLRVPWNKTKEEKKRARRGAKFWSRGEANRGISVLKVRRQGRVKVRLGEGKRSTGQCRVIGENKGEKEKSAELSARPNQDVLAN